MDTRADPVGRLVYSIAAASPLLLIWAGWIGLVAAGRWDGRAAEVGVFLVLLPLGCAAGWLAIRATRGGSSQLGRQAATIAAVFDVAIGVAAAVIGYMLATTPPIA